MFSGPLESEVDLKLFFPDVKLPPKANAGGNRVVQLPVSLVTLDGSKSSDDRGIKKFLWERDSKSLAAGV